MVDDLSIVGVEVPEFIVIFSVFDRVHWLYLTEFCLPTSVFLGLLKRRKLTVRDPKMARVIYEFKIEIIKAKKFLINWPFHFTATNLEN